MDSRLRAFLQRRGASAEEIARAEREHWLALLTADRLLVPGRPRYGQAEVAAKTGVDRALADRIWRALGFPDPPEGVAAFTDRDAEMLDVFMNTARMTIGADPDEFVEQARAVASGLARLAEFFSDQLAGAIDAGWTAGVDDEALAVAVMDGTNWSTLARLLDYTLRLQTRAALWRKLANQDVGDQSGWPLTIGFVDLVGYTALSQELDPDELARLVARFEALAYDTVAALGGRVVKMIGDEVMFVADTCEVGASIALALTGGVDADELLPVARAGLAAGPVVAREGDYFGPTVNLASRLVEIAKPGSVLVSSDVHDALASRAGFAWRRLRPRRVRDIGRVDVWALRPPTEAVDAGRPSDRTG